MALQVFVQKSIAEINRDRVHIAVSGVGQRGVASLTELSARFHHLLLLLYSSVAATRPDLSRPTI